MIQTYSKGARDQHVSFYRAQLVHYGLKDLKTRDAAKKAIQRTIEAAPNHELTVPPALLELERELESEWDTAKAAADDKARADILRRKKEAKAAAARRAAKDSEAYSEIMNTNAQRLDIIQVSKEAPII